MQESDRRDRETKPTPELTPRERQIVKLIAAGLDDKEIAAELRTSQANVASRVARMFLKYGVHRRAALVWVALVQQHLGSPTNI